MLSKLRQNTLKNYFTSIVVFILVMAGSLVVFFASMQKKTNQDAELRILNYVERQGEHFETLMETYYCFLEGISEHLSRQESLLSDNSMNLMKGICKKSDFEAMAIMLPDGSCHYDNGDVSNVSEREYFIEGMKGKRVISDPIESKIDLETRVIIGVPIIKGGEVSGILAASYNLTSVSRMLFEDIYDGEGYSVISTAMGDTVAMSIKDEEHVVLNEKNLFEFYQQFEYAGSKKTIEEIKNDFINKTKGYVKLRRGETDVRYLAYDSLSVGDWMMCYVVPENKVKESYTYIARYEFILAAVFALSVFVIIVHIYRVNVRNQRRMAQYAHTDALTGLFNKQHTEDKVNGWLSGGKKHKGVQTFVMMDIDKFKDINDVYGHIVGDEVLRCIGEKMRKSFRENDILGRIGGDEFVIFMENIDTRLNAVARIENLRDILKKIKFASMDGKSISVSIGIAFAPEDGMSYEELYVHADTALYETKRNGRDGITVYRGTGA